MTLRTCLCLVTRPVPGSGGDDGAELLLGFKKRGFGAGRWVGIGGKVDAGEEPAAAAIRELAEETGLVAAAASLAHVATLDFRFPHRPAWDQIADVYLTSEVSGVAVESDEVLPRWFGYPELPLDQMWDDAKFWLPLVLAGQEMRVTVWFGADCATVAATDPPLLPQNRPNQLAAADVYLGS